MVGRVQLAAFKKRGAKKRPAARKGRGARNAAGPVGHPEGSCAPQGCFCIYDRLFLLHRRRGHYHPHEHLLRFAAGPWQHRNDAGAAGGADFGAAVLPAVYQAGRQIWRARDGGRGHLRLYGCLRIRLFRARNVAILGAGHHGRHQPGRHSGTLAQHVWQNAAG